MNTEIDSCKYLYLRGVSEPAHNDLQVIVEEAKADGPPGGNEARPAILKDSVPVESDASCRIFKLIWPSYVAYSVRYESYTSWDESETWTGNRFRIYSKSHFLDYVARATFSSHMFPGPIKHWCLITEWYLVDVASHFEPTITRLR